MRDDLLQCDKPKLSFPTGIPTVQKSSAYSPTLHLKLTELVVPADYVTLHPTVTFSTSPKVSAPESNARRPRIRTLRQVANPEVQTRESDFKTLQQRIHSLSQPQLRTSQPRLHESPPRLREQSIAQLPPC